MKPYTVTALHNLQTTHYKSISNMQPTWM